MQVPPRNKPQVNKQKSLNSLSPTSLSAPRQSMLKPGSQRQFSKSITTLSGRCNSRAKRTEMQTTIIIEQLNNIAEQVECAETKEELHSIIQSVLQLSRLQLPSSMNARYQLEERIQKIRNSRMMQKNDDLRRWLLGEFFGERDSIVSRDVPFREKQSPSRKDLISEEVSELSLNTILAASHKKATRIFNTYLHNSDLLQYLKDRVHRWDVNIFDLQVLCQKYQTNALIMSSIHLISPLVQRLNLNMHEFISFITAISDAYLPAEQVFYHNQLHAGDVLITMNYFMRCSFFKEALKVSDLELLSALVAAIIHDVAHPGFNNQYHINTESELALRYNDRSVLENFHLATAFTILKAPENNFTSGLSSSDNKLFRKLIVQMVLGTDMFFHGKQVQKLKEFCEHWNQGSSDSLDKSNTSSEASLLDIMDTALKHKFLTYALHVADISNPAKPFEIYQQWANKICQEFFHQGDVERSQDMQVSPLFDRNKTNIPTSQIAFTSYVVQPLFRIWAEFIPEVRHCIDIMDRSKLEWKKIRLLEEEQQVEQ